MYVHPPLQNGWLSQRNKPVKLFPGISEPCEKLPEGNPHGDLTSNAFYAFSFK